MNPTPPVVPQFVLGGGGGGASKPKLPLMPFSMPNLGGGSDGGGNVGGDTSPGGTSKFIPNFGAKKGDKKPRLILTVPPPIDGYDPGPTPTTFKVGGGPGGSDANPLPAKVNLNVNPGTTDVNPQPLQPSQMQVSTSNIPVVVPLPAINTATPVQRPPYCSNPALANSELCAGGTMATQEPTCVASLADWVSANPNGDVAAWARQQELCRDFYERAGVIPAQAAAVAAAKTLTANAVPLPGINVSPNATDTTLKSGAIYHSSGDVFSDFGRNVAQADRERVAMLTQAYGGNRQKALVHRIMERNAVLARAATRTSAGLYRPSAGVKEILVGTGLGKAPTQTRTATGARGVNLDNLKFAPDTAPQAGPRIGRVYNDPGKPHALAGSNATLTQRIQQCDIEAWHMQQAIVALLARVNELQQSLRDAEEGMSQSTVGHPGWGGDYRLPNEIRRSLAAATQELNETQAAYAAKQSQCATLRSWLRPSAGLYRPSGLGGVDTGDSQTFSQDEIDNAGGGAAYGGASSWTHGDTALSQQELAQASGVGKDGAPAASAAHQSPGGMTDAQIATTVIRGFNAAANLGLGILRAQNDQSIAELRLQNQLTQAQQTAAAQPSGPDPAQASQIAALQSQLQELRSQPPVPPQAQTQDQGMSTGVKIGLGIAFAAAIGGGAYLILKK